MSDEEKFNPSSVEMAAGMGNRRILFAEIYQAAGFNTVLDALNRCRWILHPTSYLEIQSAIQAAIAQAVEETIDDLYEGYVWEYHPDRLTLDNWDAQEGDFGETTMASD